MSENEDIAIHRLSKVFNILDQYLQHWLDEIFDAMLDPKGMFIGPLSFVLAYAIVRRAFTDGHGHVIVDMKVVEEELSALHGFSLRVLGDMIEGGHIEPHGDGNIYNLVVKLRTKVTLTPKAEETDTVS